MTVRTGETHARRWDSGPGQGVARSEAGRTRQLILWVLGSMLLSASTFADITADDVVEIDLNTEVLINPFTSTTSDVVIAPGNGLRLLGGTTALLNIDGGTMLTVDAIRSEGIHSLLIEGAGSTLALGDEIVIGDGATGAGTLDLLAGGLLTIGGGADRGFTGSELLIGSNGGVGVATVNDSTIVIDRNNDLAEVRLTIGRGGDGTMNIENGASVTVQDLSGVLGVVGDGVTVGEALSGVNAVGVLNVDGAGTILTINTADIGALVAGVSGTGVESASGTINVTNGGVIDITGTGGNSGINLARGGNSTGIINISGAGSTINVTGPAGVIAVGADFGGEVGDGVGRFIASDNAVVNVQGPTPGNGFFSIAQGTGNGLLDVSSGAAINVDGVMFVSIPTAANATQSGAVDINNSGIVNTNLVQIGNRGSISISGSGSQFNVGDELQFSEGAGGTSSLSVTDGALLNVGGGFDIGLVGGGINLGENGGTTTGLIDNATVFIGRNGDNGEARLSVGRGGTGSLTVQNAAQLTVQDSSGVTGVRGDGIGVGEAFSGNNAAGSLTIQGAGTVVNVDSADSAFIAAGISATGTETADGTINVLDGAVLNVTGANGAGAFVNLARGGNAQGTLNIAGSGTEVNVLGSQGVVAVALDAFNELGNGDGLLTVTDGAVLNIAGDSPGQGFLQVGLGTGNGIAEINTGAVVNVDGFVLISDASANNDTQTGRVSVTGSGTLNALTIGVGERGVLDGDGTISADRLFVFTGGQAALQDLAGYSQITLSGGELTTPNEFNLGQSADQSIAISGGGVFSAPGASQFGGGTGAVTDLTLSDAGSRFGITGDATVNTRISVNSGAVFQTPGAVNVGVNGLLSGDGGFVEASSVNLGAGSRLEPGNSPGVLNIVGNLMLDGGTIAFEIAGNQPGEFDVLNVDGDVNLNSGDVTVEILGGFNPAGQNFDVLTTTGNYSQDPGVLFSNVGVGPDFEYVVRTEGTRSIGSINFLSVDIAGLPTLGAGQRSLAGYLDAVCPRIETLATPSAAQIDLDLRCGGLRNGANSDAQVASVLDQISPDEVFGTFQRLLNFTTIQHGNLSRRLNGLRNGGTRIDLRSFNVESEDVQITGEELQAAIEALLGEELDRWGFFSDGRINFGDRDAGNGIPGFDYDTVSLTLGTDYRVRDNFVVGAALGYNEVDADFDAGGGIKIDAWSLSLIGSYFQGNSFYIDALASYGVSDVESERRVSYQDAGGLINRSARGSTDSDQFTAGLGSGWDFSRGRWVFGPHLGANYADIAIDGYREQGALGLNLALPDTNVRSLTLNAGLHASFTLTPSWGVLVPYARLDYVKETKDNVETARVRLANDPFDNGMSATTPFRVRTENPDDSYVVWSVGAHAQFIRGFAAFADYRAITGLDDMRFGEVTVGVRYERKF